MKAKEKAKELVDSFYFKIASYPEKSICYFEYNTAKQCALICVDEVLSSHIDSVYETYYLEVKQEIEKL